MSSAWNDFKGHLKDEERDKNEQKQADGKEKQEDGTGCDWGFSKQDEQVGGELSGGDSESSKFIPIYERYLSDRQSFTSQNTKNHSVYGANPQKAIRDWFDNEGHEFSIHIEQPAENKYVCSLDLPINDQDFTLTSEMQSKKQDAIEEICLAACKMLDECELLYNWHSAPESREDSDKKRRLNEANKEDDIELDNTKRHCKTNLVGSKVNTYESLVAKWTEINMSILQLKAKLVKLDLGIQQALKKAKESSNDDDDEVDPLDEFMSNLETKTKLSMDEKIEKSSLKSRIANYEREQTEISHLIELAKPKFNLDKATVKR